MVNPLSNLRDEIAEVLQEAGIKTLQWNAPKIVPPLAIVVPHPDYVVPSEGETFSAVNVGFQVTLISSGKHTRGAEQEFDDVVVKAFLALNKVVDVVSVSAPQDVTINSAQYFGCVINIEIQFNLLGEE